MSSPLISKPSCQKSTLSRVLSSHSFSQIAANLKKFSSHNKIRPRGTSIESYRESPDLCTSVYIRVWREPRNIDEIAVSSSLGVETIRLALPVMLENNGSIGATESEIVAHHCVQAGIFFTFQ